MEGTIKKTEYTATDSTAEILTAEYIARFRDVERFVACCRECPNFGRSWICPPLDDTIEEYLQSNKKVLLIATKISPAKQGLPLSESRRLILPERIRLERTLLAMEREYGGRAFTYAGSCLHCPEGSCTRPQGLPCRHPELARPSLEAAGFNLGATASELFGIEMKWSNDGLIPEYLTLVSGFFHNYDGINGVTQQRETHQY